MSIWGSLIGGMVGFSLGGPFGMLLGSLIGGKISRARSGAAGNFGTFAQPQQIFALSLIVLSAKLSKADGHVSKEELVAVRDKLKIPENEIDKVYQRIGEIAKSNQEIQKEEMQISQKNSNVQAHNSFITKLSRDLEEMQKKAEKYFADIKNKNYEKCLKDFYLQFINFLFFLV